MASHTFRHNRSKKVQRRASAAEILESRTLLAGQIFVGTNSGGTISEYDTSGNPINAALITGLTQNTYTYFAVSGSDLFVSNFYDGTVGEYTTAGTPINTALITTGISPFGIAVAGNQLFVCNGDGGALGTSGTVGEYTLGATPGTITASSPSLITGLADPSGVTVSGSDLFISDYATGLVGEYTTAGTTINASLISGLAHVEAIALSGSDLFVTSADDDNIGEYTTGGATVNASLVSGLSTPCGLAAAGNDLFVDNAGSGVIGEYATDGTIVNASLVTGLVGSIDLAATASVGAAAQLAFATEPVATTTTGILAPITVDVEDSAGNLVTADNSDVTLSLASGTAGATLGGTTTAAAVNGVATFSNVTVSAAGSYALTATDSAIVAATSTPFTVTAPTPIKKIGALDPTFATGGLAGHSIGFPITEGIAQDVGQSVLIGTSGVSPSEGFGLTRYNADGSVDTAFGTGGVVTTSFAGTDDVPSSVIVLPGGQVLVGGTATTFTNGVASGSEFALAEYNVDGSPDTAFGAGTGQVLLSFSTTAGVLVNDTLNSLVVSSTGVIYAGGSSNASGLGTDFAIAAFTSAGSPLATFNFTGKETYDFPGGDAVINSLALQPNGAIVAAGYASDAGVTSVALARFLPGGDLDKHFGTKGVVVTSVRGVYDTASSVAIETRGDIVIGGAGATQTGGLLSSDFLLARYTSTGRLDRSFAGGTVISSFGVPSAVSKVLVESNGQIIASGKTAPNLTSVVSNQLDVALARFNINGSLDTSFNGTGQATFSLNDDDTTTSGSHISPLQLTPASDLGDEFDQFIASNQGRVSMTVGGELLISGTSGSDTVEAEVVTAGVDLATRVLTAPPAAVVAGAKGSASVQIVEDGTTQATGTVTLEIEIASDTAGDGAVSVKMLPERINLRQAGVHTIHVSFVFPIGVTAGSYYLIADVLNGTSVSLADLDTDNNLSSSASAVSIAPAFVSLAGSDLSAAASLTPGRIAHVILTITNEGNVTARGATTADFVFSTDGTTADAVFTGVSRLSAGLAALKSRVDRLSFVLPASVAAGSYVLIGVIDPLSNLTSNDQSDSNPDAMTSVTVS